MRHLESEVSRIEEESYQKAELLAPSLRNLLERAFEEHIGILCLTEVPDHVLMWAHYTDSHHGFLLEFDHTDAFFNQRKSTDDELRHLRRVSYSDKRPTLSLTEIGSFDVFLTKSKHWDYEQEWRMLVHLKDATKVVGGSLQPIHLFAFPKHAIKSVVLGSRMSADDKERIRGILSADREYSHVILRQAHEDKREYRINIEPPFARA